MVLLASSIKEEVNTNMKNATTWDGQGLSQLDFMESDTVLVLNNRDEIIGSASKKDSHVFSLQQPHAILHRAFSVFIFDKSDGRLLLQQRAASKITFPSVRYYWVNFFVYLAAFLKPSRLTHFPFSYMYYILLYI